MAPNDSAPASVVLVVDDDVVQGTIVTRMLEHAGYRAELARSGRMAITALAMAAGNVGLVLTDVEMPGIGGIELAHHIQNRWPGLPVLLMSGSNRNIVGNGQTHLPVLQKPFDEAKLAAFVRTAFPAALR